MDIKAVQQELYTTFRDNPSFVGVGIGLDNTLIVMVTDTEIDIPETYQDINTSYW